MRYREILLVLASLCTFACDTAEQRAEQYYQRAAERFDSADYVRAELDTKNALQIDPLHVDALELLAKIAEQRRDWGLMFGSLSRVTEVDPTRAEAHSKLGGLYLMAQQFDEARARVASALELQPALAEALVLQAALQYNDGETDTAVSTAESALVGDPGNVGAVTLLASMAAADDPERAAAYVNDGLAARGDSFELWLVRIGLYLAADDSAGAERGYAAAIEALPENQQLRYQLARFYAGTGRVTQGEEVLRQVVERFPDDATAKLTFAQFLVDQGFLGEADSELRGFRDADPELLEFDFALARVALLRDSRPTAEEIYAAIIERERSGPYAMRAHNALARMAIGEEDRVGADAHVAAVLTEEPGNTEALLMRADLLVSDQQSDAAISDLRAVLRYDPLSTLALAKLGTIHARRNELDLAEDQFRRLIEIDPTNLNGMYDLARVLLVEGEIDAASEILREILAGQPSNHAAGALLADVLLRSGAPEEALSVAIQLQRSNTVAAQLAGTLEEGRIHEFRLDWASAADTYRLALEMDAGSERALMGLSRSLAYADNTDDAIAEVNDFLSRDPDNPTAHNVLGELYARQGDESQASQQFERALGLDPDLTIAYQNLAARYGTTEVEQRIAVYERGRGASPNNLQLRMLLATLYEDAGRYEDAIDIYQEILDINPSMDVVANNLAALMADFREDPDSLRTAFELAERLAASKNPVYLDTVGWVHYRLGRIEESLPYLESAVQGASGVPILHYHLGMAYFRSGMMERAQEQLELAMDADDDFIGREQGEGVLGELRSQVDTGAG